MFLVSEHNSGVFSVLISNLANMSFSQGTFPTMFKLAQVTPILKKPELPSTDSANFRPISNLNNISKILERLFLSRLLPHINSSSNLNSFQSAYRPHHSTETALNSLSIMFFMQLTPVLLLFWYLSIWALPLILSITTFSSVAFPPVLALPVRLLTGFPHICVTDDSLLRLVMPALPSLILLWCATGVRPGPTPFRSLYFAYLGHRGCSWCPATTVCRWHPTSSYRPKP